MNGAHLNSTDLSYTDLSDADLTGADLSNTHLSEVRNLTQQQFDTVYSCAKAELTRLTCYHSGSTVILTYWYTESPEEKPVIEKRIKQFEQQNPNIKINAVYKPFVQKRAVFVTAAQADKAPDVLRSDVDSVSQFASRHYLLNIDSYISRSDLSDYMSAPLSYDKYNGHLYGLPQVTDFLALLYNKAEIENVGITSLATMDDFKIAAIKIKQSDSKKYGFETTGTSYYMLPFLWAFGGDMIDQHNTIQVGNAGSVAGLDFLLELQNKHKVMPPKIDFSNGYKNMVDHFKDGTTAMIFDGPWEVSNILTGLAFAGNPNNLGIAAIPIGPSSNKPRSPVGGQSYVISANTEHPYEAYKLISFMSSMDSQVAIAKENHTLPTRQSAYPGLSSDAVISAFHSIENTARVRPVIPRNEHLFDVFDLKVVAAFESVQSSPDALRAVADGWKQILAGS